VASDEWPGKEERFEDLGTFRSRESAWNNGSWDGVRLLEEKPKSHGEIGDPG
jgi:hypothetical protein